MDSNETKRVICIPSKPCSALSEAVKYYICALIPKGKVLMEKALKSLLWQNWALNMFCFRQIFGTK